MISFFLYLLFIKILKANKSILHLENYKVFLRHSGVFSWNFGMLQKRLWTTKKKSSDPKDERELKPM